MPWLDDANWKIAGLNPSAGKGCFFLVKYVKLVQFYSRETFTLFKLELKNVPCEYVGGT